MWELPDILGKDGRRRRKYAVSFVWVRSGKMNGFELSTTLWASQLWLNPYQVRDKAREILRLKLCAWTGVKFPRYKLFALHVGRVQTDSDTGPDTCLSSFRYLHAEIGSCVIIIISCCCLSSLMPLYAMGKLGRGFSQESKYQIEFTGVSIEGCMLYSLYSGVTAAMILYMLNCWLLIRSTTEILIANNVICWQVIHIAGKLREGNNR